MNEEYDVIVLGTGMKECILSGILAKCDKKKILQILSNYSTFSFFLRLIYHLFKKK